MVFAFAAHEYAADDNGKCLDGAVVHIVDVLLQDDEKRMAQCLYHCNGGYAVAEIVELTGDQS